MFTYTIATETELLATGKVPGNDSNEWETGKAHDRVEAILRATAGADSLSGLAFKGNGCYGYSMQIKTDVTYTATVWSPEQNGSADVIAHLKQAEPAMRHAYMLGDNHD